MLIKCSELFLGNFADVCEEQNGVFLCEQDCFINSGMQGVCLSNNTCICVPPRPLEFVAEIQPANTLDTTSYV